MAWGMEPWGRDDYPIYEDRKLGDVGNSEVRGATWSTAPLALYPGVDNVGKSLERNFINVIVSPPEQNYRMMITGWIPMREAVTVWEDHSVEESYGVQRQSYKTVDQRHLYDPAELIITEKCVGYEMIVKRSLLLARSR